MSWKFQGIRYQWMDAANASLQFSLGLPNVLAGPVTWHGPNGRPVPIRQLFALTGKLRAGALAWDARELQHHVRGQDLICEYPYSEATPTGIECYWRPAVLDAGGLTLEWFVSANTRLLDENIEWSAASEFVAETVEAGCTGESGECTNYSSVAVGQTEWASEPTTWESPLKGQTTLVMKLANEAGWLAMATAPGDQRRLRVNVSKNLAGGFSVAVHNELQMGFLEKGVIRRARLWCLWLPAAGEPPAAIDELEIRSVIQQQLQSFFCSPQPLTV